MESYRFERDDHGEWTVRVRVRRHELLNAPLINKSTAFTNAEREQLGLDGILPPVVSTIEQQADRAYHNIARKNDALERYIGMGALQERNEVLFYRVLLDHIEELMPIVYTPTVGEACRRFSHIFRRARGLWITPAHRGRIAQVLANASTGETRLIVVTDNERILGLGDQGAGGMGIPIGKLALYVACAGIHPSQVLPVSLDVGTDNAELLADPLYIGHRAPRLRGAEYDSLVEEFVAAVAHCFPRALLQWEDFKKNNAIALHERYRHRLASFNDDIQGTAAVGLAAVIAAGRASNTALTDQRVVIMGAGAAGVGIAQLLADALRRAGKSEAQIKASIAVLDSRGLLVGDDPHRDAHKQAFAWSHDLAATFELDPSKAIGLAEVVAAVKPTVLIGTTGQPGAFDGDVVRSMAKHVKRPAIFPLSNPTSKSEATVADLIMWSNGRALVATGSPFAPVVHDGHRIETAQANNVYIFPGVGLGAMVAEAREVSDAMFSVAATAVADMVDSTDFARGALLPRLTRLRDVARAVARAVALEAARSGLGRAMSEDELDRELELAMWRPTYPRIIAE
ncbi:MAG: NAD-dependent malic enzyme [Myxococcota bacterium]|nr:NAD-dependent malic enzyme [Myxococcota bacterium]